jgi:Putative MetA-pathway of phenol degradation
MSEWGVVRRLEVGRVLGPLLIAALMELAVTDARAEGENCPTPKDEIATDRPDVTNSSVVVPVGSFQSENGINTYSRDSGREIDGTNSRWRLGIAQCLEVFVDLPTYFANIKAPGASGWTDVAPAVKWQISPVPEKLDLSVTAGIFLPTGTTEIAGRGVQPYLQLPWSWELHDGWGLSGMFTEFFRLSDLKTKNITETTFVLEKKLTEQLNLFTEYVGDYPVGAGPSVLLNSGAVYHLDRTQQVDLHVAFGLNHNAPSYTVGVGYSFRIDGLFAGKSR